MKTKYLLILGSALILGACKTTPEVIETKEIEVELEPLQTCVPLELLTKQEVPAIIEKRMTVVLIDNPPFDPIEQAEEREVVIEPARYIYVDAKGQEVVDICAPERAIIGGAAGRTTGG